MDLLIYFKHLNPELVPIMLALFAIGLAIPFRCVLSLTSFKRHVSYKYYVLINPIIEEIIFRAFLLVFLVSLFGIYPGILIMTIIYIIYSGFYYGPPLMADAFVIGTLFSIAFFKFGFLTVLIAHITYKLITLIF